MPVPEHGELIHRVIFQVLQDLPSVRPAQQLLPVAQDLRLRLVLGGTADTAAGAHHAFHKILLQFSGLEQHHGLFAFIPAGALQQPDIGRIFAQLFHHLQDRRGHAAAAGELLAEEGCLLVGLLHRFGSDFPGIQHGDDFTVGQRVIRPVRDELIQGFSLLGDARPDKHGDAVRIPVLQVPGNRDHRADRVGLVFPVFFREMMAQHGDKRGAAGGGHLAAFFPGFDPLQRLIGGGHIAAEADLHHIREAQLFQRRADGGHGYVLAELAFRGGRAHGVDLFPAFDFPDNVHRVDPGTDRAEGAAVDTVAAVDAFLIVNHAQPVLGVCDGADRACFFAGPFRMDDRAVGAGFCAHAAGLALRRVNPHAGVAGGDGAEAACVQAGLSQAETADIRDHVILDRTVIAGGGDHCHHIAGFAVHIRILSHGQADPPADDLTFFIDAAPVLGLRAGNDLQDQPLTVIRCQFVIPCQAAYLPQDMVL